MAKPTRRRGSKPRAVKRSRPASKKPAKRKPLPSHGIEAQLAAEKLGYLKPKRKSPASRKTVLRRRVYPGERKRWKPAIPVKPTGKKGRVRVKLSLDRAWQQLAHYMELRKNAVHSTRFRKGIHSPRAKAVVGGPAQGPDSGVEGDLTIYQLSAQLSDLKQKLLYDLQYQLAANKILHVPGKPAFWVSFLFRFSRAPDDTINQANYTRHWTRAMGGLDEFPMSWHSCTRTGEALLLQRAFVTKRDDEGRYIGLVPRYLEVHKGARLVHVVVRYSWLPFRMLPIG